MVHPADHGLAAHVGTDVRIVVDNNQADKLAPAGESSPTLVFSPHVLAEVVLSPRAERVLAAVQTYDVKVGITTADAFTHVAELTRTQIHAFEPFPYAARVYANHYGTAHDVLKGALSHREPEVQRWAREMKHNGLVGFGSSMMEAEKQARERRKRDPTVRRQFETLEAVLEEVHPTERDSFVEWFTYGSASDRGQRRIRTRRRDLTVAAMKNPHLRRLLMSITTYAAGNTQSITDPKLRVRASTNRDDFTDMLLPFYAADGDVIATNDRFVQALTSFIEADGAVLAMPSPICAPQELRSRGNQPGRSTTVVALEQQPTRQTSIRQPRSAATAAGGSLNLVNKLPTQTFVRCIHCTK
jgi:hypothetical protein